MHLSILSKSGLFLFIFMVISLPLLIAQPAPVEDWVYGTTSWDNLQQFLPTADGGFIMLSSVDVGMEGNITDTLEGGIDIWVAKGDADGNIVWDEVLGGNKNDYPVKIIATMDGGYMILGNSFSDSSGDKSDPNRGENINNIWVIKTDAQGQKVWDKTYGTATSEDAASIVELSDGSFIITSDSWEGIAEFERTEPSIGRQDVWLLRINEIGDVLWDKTFGGRSRDDINDLLRSNDGGVILIGTTTSFDDGIFTAEQEGAGFAVWMVKMDLNGEVIWDRRYDGLSLDIGYKVVQTNNDGYLIIAETYSGIGGTKTSPEFSSQDVWIIRTDSEGNMLWDKTFGGHSFDDVMDVVALPNGHFLVGGTSQSNAGGTRVEANRGFKDYWVWEIDESGVVIWDKVFGGADYDELTNLWWKGNGVFAIAGTSNSEVGYEKTKPSLGNDDIWLLEVSIQDVLSNYPATPAPICMDAPLICDLENYRSATKASSQIACPLPFCNDWILAENTNWHAFHAGSENLTLRITTTNCSNIGSEIGVEAAIYGRCDSLYLLSNCWKETGEHTFDLVANNLIPDQRYYLMIDGINGSFCDYSIEVVEGSTELTTPNIVITSPLTGCFVDELVLESNEILSTGETQLFWTTADGKLLDGATTIAPIVGTSGTYQLTANKTSGGCKSAATTLEVVVESKAVKADFEVNGCSDEIILNGTNSILEQGANYIWNSEAGGQIISNPNTLHPTVMNTGIYTLDISLDDCETSQTINLSEDILVPEINIAPYPELECHDYDIEIDATASSTAPVFDYYWNSLTGGHLFSSFFNPLEAEIEDAGTYSLIIRNRETGCQDSTTFEIIRNAPYFNIFPYWEEIDCNGTPVTLGIDIYPENTFNVQYEEWTTSDGNFVTATDIPNPQIDTPGWYSGGVYDLDFGCFSLFSFIVRAAEIDSIVITPTGELTCIEETMTLNAYDNSFYRPYDFNWTTSDGLIIEGENEEELTIGASGTYYVEVTYKDCYKIDSIVIPYLEPIPSVTFNNSYSLDCNVDELTLEIEETYPDSNFCFWWQTEDGHFTSPPNQIDLIVDQAGIYQLRVTNLKTGCFSENTVQVTGNSEQPNAEVVSMGEINCGQSNLVLDGTNSSQGTDFLYQWSTTNGVLENDLQTLTPTVNATGDYLLTVTTNNGGCTATAQVSVVDNRYTLETIAEIYICEGMPYSVGNSIYYTTGIYQDTLQNFENCDSIIQTQLTVLPTSETIQTLSICEGETVTVGDETFAETGNYSVILTNNSGCDSLVMLNLTIMPTQTTSVNTQLCAGESMMIGDEIFSETGNYNVMLMNEQGCDSTILLNLTILPAAITPLDVQLCEGGNIQVGNETFSETGNYQVVLTNSFGCDSLVNLSLEIVDNYLINLNEIICPNESFDVGGLAFDSTGVYEIFLVSSTGCDSLIMLYLTVEEEYTQTIDVEICAGETFVLAGNEFSETGNYEVLLTTSFGCDSLLNLDLVVVGIPVTDASALICEGDSYEFGGEILVASGIYTDTLEAFIGCDSISILDLTIVPELLLVDTVIFDDTGSNNGSIEPIVAGGFPPYSYSWNTGETTPIIGNLNSGFYDLIVTDSIGCELTTTFFIDNLDGTKNHPFIQQFQIAPNPSNGNFDIFLQLTNAEDWTISLHRVNGQLIKKWTGEKATLSTEIKVENLIAGVYFVSLQIKEEVIVSKVIVKH